MSHAGLAIALVALGVGIGLTRTGTGPIGSLRIALALGSLALAFHLLELLAP